MSKNLYCHRYVACLLVIALTALLAAADAGAAEFKDYSNEKYGFALKVPAQFTLEGEDRTVTWSYQPGAAPAAPAAAKEEASEEAGEKKKGGRLAGLGGKLKEATQGAAASSAPSAGAGTTGGGGLQPALSIYVNWTWMPDVASGTIYKANYDSVKQDIASPDPKYKDPVVFDKKKGYSHEGNTFWYKEVDKQDGTEIHRWHIHSAGNQSTYTIGLTGTYAQFQEWGPVYEQVIKSFKLIPMKK